MSTASTCSGSPTRPTRPWGSPSAASEPSRTRRSTRPSWRATSSWGADRSRRAGAAPAIAPATAHLGDLQPVEGPLQLGGGHGVAGMLGQGLLGSAARRLGPGLVDVLRALGGIGEDDHAVGEDLQEAARDEEELLHPVVAHHDLAGPERGEQGDVVRQHPQITGRSRREHEVGLLGEQTALRGDQLDVQLRHQLPLSGFAFFARAEGAGAFLAGAAALFDAGLAAILCTGSSADFSVAGASVLSAAGFSVLPAAGFTLFSAAGVSVLSAAGFTLFSAAGVS